MESALGDDDDMEDAAQEEVDRVLYELTAGRHAKYDLDTSSPQVDTLNMTLIRAHRRYTL